MNSRHPTTLVLAVLLWAAASVAHAQPVCSSDGWCWSNPLPQGNTVISVWGTASTDVWAVGASGTILHSDGSAWSGFPSETTSPLYGVWGSASTDVWAVGAPDHAGDPGTILHWDGSAWSSVPGVTYATVFGVWGSASSDVWAVDGNGNIVHWDGSAWSLSIWTGTGLRGVWGSASNDVWAVGDGGTTLHWDGSAWAPVSSGTNAHLLGV